MPQGLLSDRLVTAPSPLVKRKKVIAAPTRKMTPTTTLNGVYRDFFTAEFSVAMLFTLPALRLGGLFQGLLDLPLDGGLLLGLGLGHGLFELALGFRLGLGQRPGHRLGRLLPGDLILAPGNRV